MADQIQERYRARMNLLARKIDKELNGNGKTRKLGFILLTAEFGKIEDGRVNYISNGERADMIAMLREYLARVEGRYCRAIGKAVEALRAMERHGAHQILDQAFSGFMALPAPGDAGSVAPDAWWVVLGVRPDASAEAISAAYKTRAREAGGASVELNAAKDAGLTARRGL